MWITKAYTTQGSRARCYQASSRLGTQPSSRRSKFRANLEVKDHRSFMAPSASSPLPTALGVALQSKGASPWLGCQIGPSRLCGTRGGAGGSGGPGGEGTRYRSSPPRLQGRAHGVARLTHTWGADATIKRPPRTKHTETQRRGPQCNLAIASGGLRRSVCKSAIASAVSAGRREAAGRPARSGVDRRA